jgi:hypothetical protein
MLNIFYYRFHFDPDFSVRILAKADMRRKTIPHMNQLIGAYMFIGVLLFFPNEKHKGFISNIANQYTEYYTHSVYIPIAAILIHCIRYRICFGGLKMSTELSKICLKVYISSIVGYKIIYVIK